MSDSTLRDDVLRLPPDERLQLVEDLWDSLAAEPSQVPIPDWHREALERRLADPNPQFVSAEEMRARLFNDQ